MMMLFARHECLAFCLLRAIFQDFEPIVGNTHITHVKVVALSFQEILRGSQLTRYILNCRRFKQSNIANLAAFAILSFKNATSVSGSPVPGLGVKPKRGLFAF